MKMYRLFFYAVLILFTAYSCRDSGEVKSFERPVTLYKVNSLNYVDKSYSAIVESAEVAQLSFEMGGEIEKIDVNSGDNVTKGEFIANIDPIQYKLQLQTTKASYTTALAENERYKRLFDRDAISKQQYEAAYATFVSKRSSYENAKNLLKNTRLYAPFSGIIEKKYVDLFQQVQPYQQIVRLINPDTLEVVFTISPFDAKLLTAPKMEYFVELEEYPETLFKAKLKRFTDISIRGEGFPVVLSIDDSRFNSERYNIKVGYTCNAIIRIENPSIGEFSAIPLSAIYTTKSSDKKYVWKYNKTTSQVSLSEITTGELFGGDMIVVKSGVSDGELIVVAGIYQLTENQRVKLI